MRARRRDRHFIVTRHEATRISVTRQYFETTLVVARREGVLQRRDTRASSSSSRVPPSRHPPHPPHLLVTRPRSDASPPHHTLSIRVKRSSRHLPTPARGVCALRRALLSSSSSLPNPQPPSTPHLPPVSGARAASRAPLLTTTRPPSPHLRAVHELHRALSDLLRRLLENVLQRAEARVDAHRAVALCNRHPVEPPVELGRRKGGRARRYGDVTKTNGTKRHGREPRRPVTTVEPPELSCGRKVATSRRHHDARNKNAPQ